MNSLWWDAWTVYKGFDNELKAKINENFESHKDNGDGTVKLYKFIKMMKDWNYHHMANRHVYEQLKQRGKDGLEFGDVLVSLHAVWSGRPICDGCSNLVAGLYLTCSKCYNKPGATFNLCSNCYRRNLYSHPHNEFVDNFRMLQTKRTEFLNIQRQENPAPRNRAQLKN